MIIKNDSMVDELFDVIKEYCGCDEKETIECAVEILDAIRNNPKKFADDFDERIEEYAEKYNRCCCCGEELITNTYEQKSEYQGCSVEEPTYERECPIHGYI